MLKPVEIDWAWLQDNLNLIIDAVNRQKPLSSSTIAIDEMPSGTMLSLTASQGGQGQAPPVDEPWKYTPDGQTAAWQKISVIIQDPIVGCRSSWIWYWGTAAQ